MLESVCAVKTTWSFTAVTVTFATTEAADVVTPPVTVPQDVVVTAVPVSTASTALTLKTVKSPFTFVSVGVQRICVVSIVPLSVPLVTVPFAVVSVIGVVSALKLTHAVPFQYSYVPFVVFKLVMLKPSVVEDSFAYAFNKA